MEISELSSEAYEYLDLGKVEAAEKILSELKKKDMNPELKFTLGALLIDIGTASNKMSYVDDGITYYEELKKDTDFNIEYNLANGYYAKYKLLKNKPNYLTKKEHLLTKAKKNYMEAIDKNSIKELSLTYINLGNTYDYIGRTIDALEYYEKVPNHHYSLLNKGIGLYEYSKFTSNYLSILKDAYDCFNLVQKMENIPLEFESICEEYINNIEAICDKKILNQLQNKTLKIPPKDNFETFIIHFCLEKKLYLNLCNFCQRCENAIGDTIIVPDMIVKTGKSIDDDSYLKLSSQLNQIKMDFVLARFLLILSQSDDINIDLISKNVIITDSLSYERDDIKVQLLKNSFSSFYNILDKISHSINLYFNLNKKSEKLNFHNVWNNRNDDINGTLRSLNNLGLTALFDIHLELELGNEKFYLRKIRNNITHNFLQIKFIKMNEDDITFEELTDNTIELAKIVKNAVIYFIRAISINERRKHEKYKNKSISKLTATTQKL